CARCCGRRRRGADVKPTRLRAVLTGVALLPVLAWTLFPIYWITTASFKTELALYAKPPQWLFTPILDNYTRVLTNIPFFQYLKNSLVIAIGTTVGSLVLGTLAGYGFARFRFRASEAVRFLVLVTRMAPRIVLVVPYYLMMQRLGLLDTYTGLLVAYVSFALPFSIWLLIGFFVDVPLDVEEAAMIDGCSRLGVLIRIVIPIAAPGLVVAAIFAFLVSWNEFLFALILSGVEAKTLPVVIAGLNTDAGPLYGALSAVAPRVVGVRMTAGPVAAPKRFSYVVGRPDPGPWSVDSGANRVTLSTGHLVVEASLDPWQLTYRTRDGRLLTHQVHDDANFAGQRFGPRPGLEVESLPHDPARRVRGVVETLLLDPEDH